MSQLVCPNMVTAIQVTHSSFLYFMMQNFGKGAAPLVQVGLLHNRTPCFVASYMGLAIETSASFASSYQSCGLQKEMHRWYENCELRSLLLSNKAGPSGSVDPVWFPGGDQLSRHGANAYAWP